MKRLVSAVVLMALLATPVLAHGRKQVCSEPCASYTVSYVEKEVMTYQCVQKSRDVMATVYENKYVEKLAKGVSVSYMPMQKEHVAKGVSVCYEPKYVEHTGKGVSVCYEPKYGTKKEWVMVYTPVQKKVEGYVTRCAKMPVTCCDPCTGCTYTVCKPVTYQEKVSYYVCEYVQAKKEVEVTTCEYIKKETPYTYKYYTCETVKKETPYEYKYYTCEYVKKETPYEYKYYTCETIKKEVPAKEYYYETVGVKTKVKVPVYTPCYAAPVCDSPMFCK